MARNMMCSLVASANFHRGFSAPLRKRDCWSCKSSIIAPTTSAKVPWFVDGTALLISFCIWRCETRSIRRRREYNLNAS
eukprot:1370603-Pyramimonas_sp.AAC.1